MEVKLISKTCLIGEFFTNSKLTDEELIVSLARISRNKDLTAVVEHPNKLLEYLLDNQHWSPFEMIDYTFFIETSIAISKQIIRHRSFVFQEMSRRYTSKKIGFEKIEFNKETGINDEYCYSLINKLEEDILYTYNVLIDNGVSKEQARFILPQHTSTHLYMKGSLRSWLTFLLQRDSIHAQHEIRMLAIEIKKQLMLYVPNIINYFYKINEKTK